MLRKHASDAVASADASECKCIRPILGSAAGAEKNSISLDWAFAVSDEVKRRAYRGLFVINFMISLGFGIVDPFFPVYSVSVGATGFHDTKREESVCLHLGVMSRPLSQDQEKENVSFKLRQRHWVRCLLIPRLPIGEPCENG